MRDRGNYWAWKAALLLTALFIVTPAEAGSLKWGTFLGADWVKGEQRLRSDLSVYIKNMQRMCTKDVEKLCLNDRYINAQASAYSLWTDKNYRRHSYKRWDDVPLGYGHEADDCLRHEMELHMTDMAKRIIPKCVEWLQKAQGQYEKMTKREKGNDKREGFVVFSTLFATSISGVVGFMVGIFMKDQNDIFQYHNRSENKKLLVYFSAAVSLPLLVILWASPKLLLLMALAFLIGLSAQYYIERRKEQTYGLVSGSDSGLVFAAIPVNMD